MTAPDDVRARFETGDPKLDSPARVGSTTFGKGVSWSTVIGAAQRAYEYRDEPKLTAEQIAAFYIAFPHLAPDPEKVRAAHADLAGEVRELVEDARWLLSQIPHNEFSHDYIKDEKRCDACKRIKRIAAALAKFHPTHQEKNDVLP